MTKHDKTLQNATKHDKTQQNTTEHNKTQLNTLNMTQHAGCVEQLDLSPMALPFNGPPTTNSIGHTQIQ